MKARFMGGWDGDPYGKTIGYTQYWHFLHENGVEIVNGCIERSRFSYSAYKHFPFIALEACWRGPRLALKNLFKEFDFGFVSFPCFYDVPVAKLVCWLKGKPLAYHPVDSQYLTLFEDRKLARKGSLKEKIYWLYDWIPFRLADAVCVHSPLHAERFAKMFGVPRRKFVVVPQGWCRPLPARRPKKSGAFVVGLASSFIPHHGVEYVLEAAKQLQETHPDVEFQLMGFGQGYAAMKEKAAKLGLRNTVFLGGRSWDEADDFVLNECDAVLGVFGTSLRTELNVPNKLWAALAFGKPLITAESAGVREVGLRNRVHALLVEKRAPPPSPTPSRSWRKTRPYARPWGRTPFAYLKKTTPLRK